MRKPITQKAEGQHPLAGIDEKAFAPLPNLRSFFMDATYSEGKEERQQGQMIVRAEPCRWTLVLKEPAACTQLYVAAPTWGEIMKLADALLGSPTAPWAPDTWAQARRPKKGGK